MLSIRFLRTGKKNQPFFRIVVCNKGNAPQTGRFLEILGFYNPLTKKRNLKAERIKYWLSVGAKCSDTVHNLLITEKVIEGKKIPVHKKKKVKEGEEQEKPKEQAGVKPETKEPEVKGKPEKKEEQKTEAKETKTEVKEKPKQKLKEEPKTEEKKKPSSVPPSVTTAGKEDSEK
ncbi:30S ribosomal protein S16 [Candidatus Parcubacteria bacterium]|nr:30S ribosomal protein S16 [Candidatus Parcubacteria bacterium]